MMGEDTPGTFTPRTERKGFIMDQIEALQHMLALGSDLVDAVVACISGHRMTPDMAALCITTYWRRYAAIAQYQEARGAAITIQVRHAPHSHAFCSFHGTCISEGCQRHHSVFIQRARPARDG